jgi:hypothetical protein
MTDSTIPAIDGGAGGLVPFDLPVNPSYEQIRALEHEIAKLPPVDTPLTHHFADGVYGREMFIPAGTVITGKIHRMATLNILLSGTLQITTDEGVQMISAPAVFVTEPDTKKVCYAHTDARFMNVHPTKLRDLSAIEAKFIVPEIPVLRYEG